jgi:hypothetical protein
MTTDTERAELIAWTNAMAHTLEDGDDDDKGDARVLRRIAALLAQPSEDAERMEAALDALNDDDVSGAMLILYEGIRARKEGS